MRLLLIPTACFALQACGERREPNAKTGDNAAQQEAGLETSYLCDAALACDEKLGDNANSVECIALRAKLTAEKAKLKLSSEWRNVEKTPQWAAFETDRKHFRGADCKWDTTEPTDECNVLKSKLHADWEAIEGTPQWEQLSASGNFQEIKSNTAKAKQIGCFQ